MYLNYKSENPISLKDSIPYSQFLRLKMIHSEPKHLSEAQIHKYLYFVWREYPCNLILRKWEQASVISRDLLLTPKETTCQTKTPLMFITTYSMSNPNFKEIISKHWSYLGRSSITTELGKQDFMIRYRKPPSLKDLLVRAKILQPSTPTKRGTKHHTPANIVAKFHN